MWLDIIMLVLGTLITIGGVIILAMREPKLEIYIPVVLTPLSILASSYGFAKWRETKSRKFSALFFVSLAIFLGSVGMIIWYEGTNEDVWISLAPVFLGSLYVLFGWLFKEYVIIYNLGWYCIALSVLTIFFGVIMIVGDYEKWFEENRNVKFMSYGVIGLGILGLCFGAYYLNREKKMSNSVEKNELDNKYN